jgi:hypothetical protein
MTQAHHLGLIPGPLVPLVILPLVVVVVYLIIPLVVVVFVFVGLRRPGLRLEGGGENTALSSVFWAIFGRVYRAVVWLRNKISNGKIKNKG